MRTLPTGMQAHLDGGVTTLCWCWELVRSDGVVLGFTDHDQDVTVAGVVYSAETGFTASAVQTDLGMNITTLDVQGMLRSDQLTEVDLAGGLWDNASISLFRVNWLDTSMAVLMRKGTVGEVKRGNFIFTAELRGLAHAINQVQGRLYMYSCDADLGDSRCAIDLTNAAYHGTGTITGELFQDRWFQVSGLLTFINNWFTGGKLTWTSGNNIGTTSEVRIFSDTAGSAAGGREIELWLPTNFASAVGDTFNITAGCDKAFGTCRYKFNNAVNFRGFPWMPSNDRVTAYPDPDALNDGGSLFGN